MCVNSSTFYTFRKGGAKHIQYLGVKQIQYLENITVKIWIHLFLRWILKVEKIIYLNYLNQNQYIKVVIMVNYIIIHNKHEGCYDFQYYEDPEKRVRLTSITINPPKIFLFNNKEEAQDFFEEYINDVDCIDNKCKKGDDVEHVNYCTCGIIELDEEENPILFYNKKNQIFLMENGPQVFLPPQELKNDVKNLNLTNSLIRKCKTLGKHQRERYIELGNYCQEINAKKLEKEQQDENIEIKNEEDDNSSTSSKNS